MSVNHCNPHKQNYINAFTLTELCVSLSIISLIALIAVPRYQHCLNKTKLAAMQIKAQIVSFHYQRFVVENGTFPEDLTLSGSDQNDIPILECINLRPHDADCFFILSITRDINPNVFTDPFEDWSGETANLYATSKDNLNILFPFLNGNQKGGLLISRGPDREIESETTRNYGIVFDASNGLSSSGDIFISIPENKAPVFIQ